MAIAVAADQIQGNTYTFGVCPNWSKNDCTCPKDLTGAPIPPHTVFSFDAQPPTKADGTPDGRSQAQWLQDCATEGLRIVKQNAPEAAAAPASSNVGKTLS